MRIKLSDKSIKVLEEFVKKLKDKDNTILNERQAQRRMSNNMFSGKR